MRILEMIVMKLIHRSIYASFLILAVCIVRKLFREIPKKYLNILWLFVFIRLICPWNIQTLFSILPVQSQPVAYDQEIVNVPQMKTGIQELDERFNHSMIQYNAVVSKKETAKNQEHPMVMVISLAWAAGCIAITVYSLIHTYRIKKHLNMAVREEENIYHSEAIQCAFLMGLLHPRIYLPLGLTQQQREHIVMHERVHIKRKDHIMKPLYYGICVLHWFNPLVWFGFSRMTRDIEMAVDERVCSQLAKADRTSYAKTLLDLSTRTNAVMPLTAFGDKPVTERIKKVLFWKKQKKLLSVLAFVLILIVLLCAGTSKEDQDTMAQTEKKDAPVTEQNDVVMEEASIPNELPIDTASSDTDHSLALLVLLRTDDIKKFSQSARVVELLGLPVSYYGLEASHMNTSPEDMTVTVSVNKGLLDSLDCEMQQKIAESVFKNCAVIFATNKIADHCTFLLTDETTQWKYQYDRTEINDLFTKMHENLYEHSASEELLKAYIEKVDQYIENSSQDKSLMEQDELSVTSLKKKEITKISKAKDVRESFTCLHTEQSPQDKYYLLGKTKKFKLYGTADFQTLIVAAGKKYVAFDYPYDSNYMILPGVYEGDYDQDGTNELVILLSVCHGTGINVQSLLMMDQKEKSWKAYQLTPGIYEKNLKGHISREYSKDGAMYLRIDEKSMGKSLRKSEDSGSWISYAVGDQIAYSIKENTIQIKAEIAAMQDHAATGQYFGDTIVMDVNYGGAGKWTFTNAQYVNTQLEQIVTNAVYDYYTQDKKGLNANSVSKKKLYVCDKHYDNAAMISIAYDGSKLEGDEIEVIATVLPEGTDSYDYITFELVYKNNVLKIKDMWVEK